MTLNPLEDIAYEALQAYAPKKRRKSRGPSPTARTLAECRKRGWIAQVVERTIPHTFIKQDLFGCIDIVAITTLDGGLIGVRTTVGIQATGDNAGDMQRRVRKILAEPRIKAWIEAGNRMEVWGWGKRGAAGKRKAWTLRVKQIAASDYAEAHAKERAA
jgi:hypothetical protein